MPINERLAKHIPSIANRIRSLRVSRDMSASDLARAVGVTPTAVWNWENGNTVPRHLALVKLAQALEASVEYISGDDSSSKRVDRDKVRAADPDFSAIVEQARRDLALRLGLPVARVEVTVKFN